MVRWPNGKLKRSEGTMEHKINAGAYRDSKGRATCEDCKTAGETAYASYEPMTEGDVALCWSCLQAANEDGAEIEFTPTHVITVFNTDGDKIEKRIPVASVDADEGGRSLYTQAEWESESGADWTMDAETGLVFQGQARYTCRIDLLQPSA
jgi:hypothetical protein